MWIVNNRKIFYGFSIILAIVCLYGLFTYGLNLGIDFKGGSLLEINYAGNRPSQDLIEDTLSPLNLDASVREAGEQGFIIRMRNISEAERLTTYEHLTKVSGKYEVTRFTSIGPVLGAEAARKSVYSIILVLVAILLFIAFVFRKVSEPVSSWKYGIIALLALFHDVLIPIGAFTFLGYFAGLQVDTLFVTAVLVVLGFSIHDTIVVFDRVRENLKHEKEAKEKNKNHFEKPFENIVGESINETFARSINTSLTTIFAVAVLYAIGGEATRPFALTLLIGLTSGTYSSIFIASPMLVTVKKWKEKKIR